MASDKVFASAGVVLRLISARTLVKKITFCFELLGMRCFYVCDNKGARRVFTRLILLKTALFRKRYNHFNTL